MPFRIRQRLPSGKFDYWHNTYETLKEAVNSLVSADNSATEIIDAQGKVVVPAAFATSRSLTFTPNIGLPADKLTPQRDKKTH
jgi:hypothetical protein